MTQNSKWYNKWLDVQADRDRLAAACGSWKRRKRLTYLLGMWKNGRLEDITPIEPVACREAGAGPWRLFYRKCAGAMPPPRGRMMNADNRSNMDYCLRKRGSRWRAEVAAEDAQGHLRYAQAYAALSAAEALAILAGDPEPDQRPAPETTPHPVPFMTRPELAEEMERLYREEQRLREAGQQEYARTDNAFANFVRVAEYLGLRPEQVLLVYLLKHIDGISAWANGHRSQRENVRGRINDARVYLAILAGMARCYEEASADE